MKLKYIGLITFWLVGQTFIASANNGTIKTVPKFEKNDVVVFIGDSITHGGSYHKNIFLFNATRYPNKPFKYYNAGISGDTAKGSIKRFEQDIAIHRPTKTSIMLGMNDVGSWLYESVPNTAEQKMEQKQQKAIVRNEYLGNMQKIADSLKQLNSEIIFITPSIYDQTAKLKTVNNIGRNDELAVYSEEVTKLASFYDASVVDFQKPMLEINAKWQKLDASRTIVSEDRVHPKEQGHFLMAYSFLKAQHESRFVSDIKIDARQKSISKMYNCRLTRDITFKGDNLSFGCEQQALPFPVVGEQLKMLSEIPFQQELNQQRFMVSDLTQGVYQLKIGGQLVGEYTDIELADGVNLALNEKTPMLQQAMDVKAVNDKRAEASGLIRNIMHVRFTMLSKYPDTDLSNNKEVESVLTEHLKLSEGKPWHVYLQGGVAAYLEHAKNEDKLRQQVESLFDKIYQINQTQSYVWQLTKA